MHKVNHNQPARSSNFQPWLKQVRDGQGTERGLDQAEHSIHLRKIEKASAELKARRLTGDANSTAGLENSRARSCPGGLRAFASRNAAEPSATRILRAVSTDEGANNSQSRSSKWQADRPNRTYTGLKLADAKDAKPNSWKVNTRLKASDSRDRCFARSSGLRRSGKHGDGRAGKGWREWILIIAGLTAHRYSDGKRSPRRQPSPRQFRRQRWQPRQIPQARHAMLQPAGCTAHRRYCCRRGVDVDIQRCCLMCSFELCWH
jgi:hypothetical protein